MTVIRICRAETLGVLFSIALIAPQLSAADCNSNGVEDLADVEAGTSEDCNSNRIPDECEVVSLGFEPTEETLPMDGTLRATRFVDVDGDGRRDIVALSTRVGRAAIAIARAGESGEFDDPSRVELELAYQDLDVADMSGDGVADVVLLASDGIHVFPGSTTLSAPDPATGVRSVVSGSPRAFALGDIDGDGDKDAVVVDRDSDVLHLLVGQGLAFIEMDATLAVGRDPRDVLLRDFDGDGNLDLLSVDNASSTLSLLQGLGGGAFGPATAIETPFTRPTGVATADLDADGLPEIVAIGSSIAVYPNRGARAFGPPSIYAGGGTLVEFGDFDLDGDLDLVAPERPDRISIRFNDGHGRLGVRRSSPFVASPVALEVFDANADGDLDLGFGSSGTRSASVYRGGEASGESFRRVDIPLTGCRDQRGCRPHGATSGDLNGDGVDDFVVSITHPGTFAILEGGAGGGLSFERLHVFGGEHPQTTTAGDLDGDGDTDLVTADNIDNSAYVHLNRGDGTFATPRKFAAAAAAYFSALADVNGDGHPDILIGNEGASSVSVLLGDGRGAFKAGAARDYRVRGGPKSISTGDLDGDGDIDLAVGSSGTPSVTILWNEDGAFARSTEARVRGATTSVATGDVDGDGDVDIVTGEIATRQSTILLNAGAGDFEIKGEAAIGHGPYSVQLVDVDADGNLDIVTVSESSSEVAILRGDGDGVFPNAQRLSVGAGPRFAGVRDFDADGDLDIAVNLREGLGVTVLYQERPSDPEPFLPRICTASEFLSLADSLGVGTGERFVKFLAPVRDDPSLLGLVFQNTQRYRLHEEFLASEFADRFPGLGSAEYTALVGKRATRDYFAGSISRILRDGGVVYGFSVFADFADEIEALSSEEVRAIHDRVSAAFGMRPFAYAPRSRAAIEVARAWTDPGFPIVFPEGTTTGGSFEAYTRGVGYGRVRMLTLDELEAASAAGGLGFQDIVVLDESPRDIESVVAGVITGTPQDELSHVAVRTARRGTPNAHVEDAREAFAPFEDQLVRLEVRSSSYEVRASDIDEARAWWEASRPRLPVLPVVDRTHRRLADLTEILSEENAGDDIESRYGGKASHLARLGGVLEGEDERYRAVGFAIPMSWYEEFIDSNLIESFAVPGREVTYREYLAELLADATFQSDPRTRSRRLEELRDHMNENGRISVANVRTIAVRIASVFGGTSSRVRFRSSSNVEDALEFNGAGLYDSTSACAADDLDNDSSGPSRCDATRPDERGVARALMTVWSSLWNFRAYEERAYYGIPQENVSMAVLVTEAFPGEQVNGVAFTGNPASDSDDRYIVVAQMGDTSVVSPPPGVNAEKSVLEVVSGEVRAIERVRRSTLVETGESVLSDDRLRELGSLLARIDARFPIDLGSYERSDVLLDFEFKIEASGALIVKQVRPFLRARPSAVPSPIFEWIVPPATAACGAFRENRGIELEHALLSRVRFRSGRIALPSDRDTFPGALVEEFIVGRDRRIASSEVGGVFRRTQFARADGVTTYRYEYEEVFALPGGERVVFRIANVDFEARDGVPLSVEAVLDETALVERLEISAEFSDRDSVEDLRFSSCAYESIPRWRIEAEAEGIVSLDFEERYRPDPIATGPARLVFADVAMNGDRRQITDYFLLAYSAARHNELATYRVVVDPPLLHPTRAVPVAAIDLVAPQLHLGNAARIILRDEQLALIDELESIVYSKNELGAGGANFFQRGDADTDGFLRLADAILILRHLFSAGSQPTCMDAADADDNARLGVGDAVRVIQSLVGGGGPLPAPFGSCGRDTVDPIGCSEYPACTGG
jgi:hypothetical protein